MDAIKIGRWKTGYDPRSKQCLLICEFTDREPLALAIDASEAPKIGRALCDLNSEGAATPLRLS